MRFKKLTKLMAVIIAAVMMVGVVKVPVEASTYIGQGAAGNFRYRVYYLYDSAYRWYDSYLVEYHKTLHSTTIRYLLPNYSSSFSHYEPNTYAYNINLHSISHESNEGVGVGIETAAAAHYGTADGVNIHLSGQDETLYIDGNAPVGYYRIVASQTELNCRWEKYYYGSYQQPLDYGSFYMPATGDSAAYLCCVYSTSNVPSTTWSVYN